MNEIPDSSSEVTEEKYDTSPDLEHGPQAIGCCGFGRQTTAGEKADDKDNNNNNNNQSPNGSTATGAGKEQKEEILKKEFMQTFIETLPYIPKGLIAHFQDYWKLLDVIIFTLAATMVPIWISFMYLHVDTFKSNAA